MRIAGIFFKILVFVFMFLCATPAMGEPSTSKILPVEKIANKTPDSGVVSAKEGSAKLKILPVTKIRSLGNSAISKEELKRYLILSQDQDLSKAKDVCNKSKREVILKWINQKRIPLKKSPEDTSPPLICNFFQKKFLSKEYEVSYCYVKNHGTEIDSLLFTGHTWECPDYRTFLLFPSYFPFVKLEGNFNYIGNNYGAASTGFVLKPFFWDKYMKKYTKYTPIIPADDSASLVINSVEGFKIEYKESTTLKSTEREKQLILENISPGIPDASCFTSITIEKLATVNGISRFVGLVQVNECFYNTWYLADIEKDHCVFTLLELNDAWHDPEFYCAYSLGDNNLPDVYVWGISAEQGGRIKEIYYKSNDLWVYTDTQMEYTGNCFNENDE